MTALLILDPMIRGGAIALFLLWIAILWRDHRAALAARVAIAMHVAIIAYLLSHGFHSDDRSFPPFAICDALSAMVPALFWLFVRLWFDDQQRIGWRSWLLVAAFAMLPLIQIALIGTMDWFSLEIWVLVRIGMFAFAVAGMWIAWRGRAYDLIEARRGFRAALPRLSPWAVWLIAPFLLISLGYSACAKSSEEPPPSVATPSIVRNRRGCRFAASARSPPVARRSGRPRARSSAASRSIAPSG